MYFPINETNFKGLPINRHPGAFGCQRKYDIHTGVDLYGKPHDPVFAIKSGVVVTNQWFTGPAINMSWWLPTYAVVIKNDDNSYYLYGELCSGLLPNTRVEEGDYIGRLLQVLPDFKLRWDIPGHSTTMLHLEKYNSSYVYNDKEYWSSWDLDKEKPSFLEDPSYDLMTIMQQNNSYKFL